MEMVCVSKWMYHVNWFLLLVCIFDYIELSSLFLGFHSCYSFDIPAALKTQIDDYTSENPSYETYFSLFYSLYALPNVSTELAIISYCNID